MIIMKMSVTMMMAIPVMSVQMVAMIVLMMAGTMMVMVPVMLVMMMMITMAVLMV